MKKALITRYRYFNLTNRFTYAALVILIFISAYSANAQDRNKLSPAFRYIIDHPLTPENEGTYPALYKAAVKDARNPKTGQFEKGLMCIIYTDKPEAFEERGIAIQSRLPRFVTAWITVQ